MALRITRARAEELGAKLPRRQETVPVVAAPSQPPETAEPAQIERAMELSASAIAALSRALETPPAVTVSPSIVIDRSPMRRLRITPTRGRDGKVEFWDVEEYDVE
jgi:hypothetical protein